MNLVKIDEPWKAPERVWWCQTCRGRVGVWGGTAGKPPPRCPDCHGDNFAPAEFVHAAEQERLRAEVERLRAEVERLNLLNLTSAPCNHPLVTGAGTSSVDGRIGRCSTCGTYVTKLPDGRWVDVG